MHDTARPAPDPPQTLPVRTRQLRAAGAHLARTRYSEEYSGSFAKIISKCCGITKGGMEEFWAKRVRKSRAQGPTPR